MHSITMNNVFATSILFCQQKPWRGRAAEKGNCWKLGGKHQNTEMGERCCCSFPVNHRDHCWESTPASLWVSMMLCCLHLFTASLALLDFWKQAGFVTTGGYSGWCRAQPGLCVSPPTSMFEKTLIDTHFTNLKSYLFQLCFLCFLLLRLNTRKNLITERVVQHWSRLCREVVECTHHLWKHSKTE